LLLAHLRSLQNLRYLPYFTRLQTTNSYKDSTIITIWNKILCIRVIRMLFSLLHHLNQNPSSQNVLSYIASHCNQADNGFLNEGIQQYSGFNFSPFNQNRNWFYREYQYNQQYYWWRLHNRETEVFTISKPEANL
jgi:hypothetical protein